MKVREWLNNNSAAATIGAVVILLISLVVMLWSNGVVGGNNRNPDSYYYDVKTHKLFVAKAGQIPPIDAPSGKNNGVAAHVFSYTDCSDKSSRFIGWLERYTNRAKRMLQNANQYPDIGPEDDLIRLPNSSRWFSAMSPQGNMIMTNAILRHGSKHGKKANKVKRCYP